MLQCAVHILVLNFGLPIFRYVHLRELRLPGSLSGPMELSEVMGTLKAVSVFEIAGPACHRELDRISAVQFAVSVRKVAAFLFANRYNKNNKRYTVTIGFCDHSPSEGSRSLKPARPLKQESGYSDQVVAKARVWI